MDVVQFTDRRSSDIGSELRRFIDYMSVMVENSPQLDGSVGRMAENTYDAAEIQVLEFDDGVRARPGMYFGVAQEDPRLATQVLSRVVGHALHPASGVAPSHSLWVIVEISADLAFSVADDHAGPLDEQGRPRLGYYGSILGGERWLSAAAAVSSRAVVEVWREGRGFRQELLRLRPAAAPEEFQAPPDCGTRVSFELDPAYFSCSAITRDLGSLDLHGPDCAERAGPGYVTFRDHRDGGAGAECRRW
ncbi:hypothetical protein ACFXOM_31850 [Streptomyces sp. NPDC059169]|uniref:hypothetical protein n=1 Tax=Streptomyces sp. NPDC059169 TaxID=3346754 RepID=UPI00367C2ECD